jgi:hypothetical protein
MLALSALERAPERDRWLHRGQGPVLCGRCMTVAWSLRESSANTTLPRPRVCEPGSNSSGCACRSAVGALCEHRGSQTLACQAATGIVKG